MIGGIADEEPDLLHLFQFLSNSFETAQEEVADREMGSFGLPEKRADGITEKGRAIIDDVVRHCCAGLCQKRRLKWKS